MPVHIRRLQMVKDRFFWRNKIKSIKHNTRRWRACHINYEIQKQSGNSNFLLFVSDDLHIFTRMSVFSEEIKMRT